MKTIIILIIFLISSVAMAGEVKISEEINIEYQKVIHEYYDIISKEDAEAYRSIHYPGASINISKIITDWQRGDYLPNVRNIELLHQENDLAILRVTTDTDVVGTHVISRDISLVVLRKWEDKWKIWLVSILQGYKLG